MMKPIGRVEAEKNLAAVQTQTAQATATRNRQNRELAKVNAKFERAQSDLAKTQVQAEANVHQIEFTDAFLLLFSDIERISPSYLYELAGNLVMIYQARLNPAAIYPIDYEGTRAKAVTMLELALGRKLVAREKYDEIVEKHDNLMMDKLWKMDREKAEYAAIKDEAARMSLDRALTAALRLENKGYITHHKCRVCKRLIAALFSRTEYNIAVCPYCGAAKP